MLRMDVKQALNALNRAWLEGDEDGLHGLLAEEVIFVAPGYAQELRGRGVCVESYLQFIRASSEIEFRPLPPRIDILGDIAVVIYAYQISWSADGSDFNEPGRDLLVWRQTERGLRLIWRTVLST